jgi:hypothetical protein
MLISSLVHSAIHSFIYSSIQISGFHSETVTLVQSNVKAPVRWDGALCCVVYITNASDISCAFVFRAGNSCGHKTQGIYWLNERLTAYQRGLYSLELIMYC